jgi:hypothetical protein
MVNKPTLQLRRSVLAVAIGISVSGFAFAGDWQPMSSERLIKLPAPVIAKAVEQDFQNSALAQDLDGSHSELGNIKSTLENLTQELGKVEGAAADGVKYELLTQKSAYLDEMTEYQSYRRQAAETRLSVYQNVLEDLQKAQRRGTDPEVKALTQKQLESRARMQASQSLVDTSLFPALEGESSRYSQEYDTNMDKIKQLQAAIREHEANRSAMLDGESVSREAFVRSLLAEAETDLALLDQEDEMLSYMARLVALDAQALQMAVAYGGVDGGTAKQDPRKPRNMVDLFVN